MTEDTFCMLLAGFMEAIHVELTHETIHFAVAEEERKDDLLEFGDIFDDKVPSSRSPKNGLGVFIRLSKFGVLH